MAENREDIRARIVAEPAGSDVRVAIAADGCPAVAILLPPETAERFAMRVMAAAHEARETAANPS